MQDRVELYISVRDGKMSDVTDKARHVHTQRE